MSRRFWLGMVVAILIALGIVAVRGGAWVLGFVLLALALALATAFFALVFFPARIPDDTVLVIRLSGRIREHGLRSPLDQLVSRGAPSLYRLRQALEAA